MMELASPSGTKLRYAARLEFSDPYSSTTNTTEYEALLLGLRKMKALGHPNFIIKSDLKVITNHVEKESEARKPEMKLYLEAVRAMEKHFKGFTVIHIPIDQNKKADKLAKATARKEVLPPDMFYDKITKPSTKQSKERQVNTILSEDWRSPIMAYLRGHFEPSDEKEEKIISQRARNYIISDGEIYKSGVVAPWLKSISTSEGKELL